MAISDTQPIVRLPFSARERYGSPYPDGLAFGYITLTGDATTGVVTFAITSEAGFIYRLEELQMERDDNLGGISSLLVVSNWLESWSGHNPPAGDFFFANPGSGTNAPGNSRIYQMPIVSTSEGLPKIPIGFLTPVAISGVDIILRYSHDLNTENTVYQFRVLMTYWKKEALYLPGFLSSFYRTPVVPSPLG